jgi:hypothetical protein
MAVVSPRKCPQQRLAPVEISADGITVGEQIGTTKDYSRGAHTSSLPNVSSHIVGRALEGSLIKVLDLGQIIT